MSEEMKEITAVPTLTFEPFESEQAFCKRCVQTSLRLKTQCLTKAL